MAQIEALPTRRVRFRSIIARLDGSDDPENAVRQGLCLPRPDAVIERLTASLEIRPNGSHLIVGSVGSGKTTTLLCSLG